MKAKVRTTDLLLLAVVMIWGGHFAVVKQALSEVDPMAFSVVRFSVAALVLLALVRIREGSLALPREDWLPMLGLGLLGGTNQMLWMYGLSGTTSGKSALILAASPAFVALMRAARGERIGARSGAALVLAFVGVALIVDLGGGVHLRGDLLTLASAFVWATYVNTGPRMLSRHSPLRVTAYVFTVTALVTSVPGIGQAAATGWDGISSAVWIQLAYSSLLAGGLAWVLWYRGVSDLGPVRVMLYQYLVPVVALAVSVMWLAEPFLPRQGLGALMVILGTLGARVFLPSRQPVRAENR